MKRFNIPLILGSLIIFCLLILILFPAALTSRSPYTLQSMRSRVDQGVLEFQSAPYPPSKDFPLGSDEFGRDIWSHIVYGARLTVLLSLLVVLGRFSIALPMALNAGFGGSLSRSITQQFSLLFSAVPALLISIIILKQDFFLSLDKGASILVFVVVLSLVGWAKLGNLLLERVEDIMKQPFIRTEIAMGKGTFRIALENVIPHLLTEMTVLLFMETSAVLSLLMQLGIFGVYVGNLRIIKDTQGGIIQTFNISFEPEWASMLGTARNMIYNAPWMVLCPAAAFFVAVLGFNFLGEGFRSLLQSPGAGNISVFRSIMNPMLLLKKLRHKRPGRGSIFAALGILLIIGGLYVSQQAERFSCSEFDMTGFPSAEVITGTDNAAGTALLIRDEMKLLGLEPLFSSSQAGGEGFFSDYEIEPVSLPLSSEFILSSGDEVINLHQGIDFSFLALGSYSRTGAVYDASADDLLNIRDYSLYDDVFIIIDKEYYSDESLLFIMDRLGRYSSPLGILLKGRTGESPGSSIARLESRFFVLFLSRETAGLFSAYPDSRLTVSAGAKSFDGGGRSIAGIKRGTDPDLEDEIIVFSMGYNYLGEEGRAILQFYLSLMKTLCTEYDNRRSYVFLFPDGTLSEEQNGLSSLMDSFPFNSSDVKVSIDLSRVNHREFESLSFNGQQAPVTRYYAWSLAHLFEINMERRKIPVSEISSVYRGEFFFPDSAAANVMFWGKGIANIVIGTAGGERRSLNLDDLGSLLLETIEMNDY